MSNGLYNAFLGMRARQRHLDTLANNIANASTTGFKTDGVRYEELQAIISANAQTANAQTANAQTASSQPVNAQTPSGQTADNQTSQPASSSAVVGKASPVIGVGVGNATNFATGSIRPTGRSLDVALEGDGFLAVQTPQGERYTRAGALVLDASGQLTTHNGELVTGERGPITIPPGEVSINQTGEISVNGQNIDHLRIVRFNNLQTALAKTGNTMFVATGTEKPIPAGGSVRVVGGALEMSNVNPVTEMAAMMQTNREFESLQKSVSLLMNDLGRKVSNEIGRI